MKKKLKIAGLKVNSFVTELKEEQNEVKGGAESNQRACYFSVVVCYSVDYCPTEDIRCETRFC
ncbi:MAG: pinensin family lanthipeptide [Cyclobacteriaceae bacterium]